MVPTRGFLLIIMLALTGLSFAAVQDSPGPVLSPGQFNLDEWDGRVVLVDFWASWCKPCKKSVPWMRGLQEEFGDQGLVIVAVNLDKDPAKAQPMMQEFGPGVVHVSDPEGILATRYKLKGVPTAFLYDRQGLLTASHIGFHLRETEDREKEIRKVLGEGKDR